MLKRPFNAAHKFPPAFGVLTAAARKKDIRAVGVLLEQGAAIDEKSVGGATALIIAATAGNVKIVRLLVDKGAALDEKDDGGRTALAWAENENHSEIVRVLKEAPVLRQLQAKEREKAAAVELEKRINASVVLSRDIPLPKTIRISRRDPGRPGP